jgi:hypothetical protein
MDILTPDIGLITWMIIGLLMIFLWISALVSIIRNEFYGQNEKLIWALLVIFLPFIGTILYFTIGLKRIKPQ